MNLSLWLRLLLPFVLSAPFAAGCTKQADALSNAVYASQIPIYPGAIYEDSFGGTGSDAIGGPPTSESLSWFFNVKDPAEKVVAFYAEKLPGVTHEELDSKVTFQFAPQGAEQYEWVWIRISPGKLQITESVRFGKRKSD